MLGKGGVNSRPDSYGVPDGVRTDGPGFSLCAAPLESLGPVFQDGRGDGMNERRFVEGWDMRWKILGWVWVMGMRGSEFRCCTECNSNGPL